MLEKEFIEAVGALDDNRCMAIANEFLAQGYSAQTVINLLNEGVKEVGSKFATGEFFIGDLIVSGMLYRSIISLFSSPAAAPAGHVKGRIVIGVAQDDIHDIGKDIVVSVLRAEGFEVIDLGVDVEPERFIHAVETYAPDILLMSGLMSCTLDYMRQVVQMLQQRGLRNQVAVLVGGSIVDEYTKDYVGADAATKDPSITLQFCKEHAARGGDQ